MSGSGLLTLRGAFFQSQGGQGGWLQERNGNLNRTITPADGLGNLLQNISTSITNIIRNTGNTTGPAIGDSWQNETIVRVRWALAALSDHHHHSDTHVPYRNHDTELDAWCQSLEILNFGSSIPRIGRP